MDFGFGFDFDFGLDFGLGGGFGWEDLVVLRLLKSSEEEE